MDSYEYMTQKHRIGYRLSTNIGWEDWRDEDKEDWEDGPVNVSFRQGTLTEVKRLRPQGYRFWRNLGENELRPEDQ